MWWVASNVEGPMHILLMLFLLLFAALFYAMLAAHFQVWMHLLHCNQFRRLLLLLLQLLWICVFLLLFWAREDAG